MHNFTPLSAMAGGALIGLAASMMMLYNGRIAGISGIFGGLLRPTVGDIGWRAAFIAGLLVGGFILLLGAPDTMSTTATRTLVTTGIAGVFVGVGVRLGNGCTSGHGVCGLTRMSRRSLLAVLTFMATGMLTASAVEWFAGGVL